MRRHRAIHHVLSTVTNIVSEHNSRGGQVANRLSPTLTTIDLAFAGVTRRGRLCVALENLVCAQANDRPRKSRLAEVAKAVASLAYQRLAPPFMLENGPAKEATNEIFPECLVFFFIVVCSPADSEHRHARLFGRRNQFSILFGGALDGDSLLNLIEPAEADACGHKIINVPKECH